MQARVTRTRASVGSAREASGTSSMRTSPAENMTVARIGQATSFEVVEGVTVFTKARSGACRVAWQLGGQGRREPRQRRRGAGRALGLLFLPRIRPVAEEVGQTFVDLARR